MQLVYTVSVTNDYSPFHFCCKESLLKCQKISEVVMSTVASDVNIRADFVGRFSACYDGRSRERFSDLRFGATLTFKLIARF